MKEVKIQIPDGYDARWNEKTQNVEAIMEGWTKITPEQIEAIGFVDLTEEDRTNLAYYEYRGKKPEHVEWMFMNFLAVYWELSFSSDIDGDEYHDIKTAEEFNHWMKYIGLEIRL